VGIGAAEAVDSASKVGGGAEDEEDEDDDYITFEMYEKMVYENNDIIKWLAIDLQRVCQSAKLILSDKAAIKNISS